MALDGALAEWALDHPGDPHSQEALAAAHRHRSEWLHGYRGCFGFLTLVLRPGGGSGRAVSRVGSFG